jgi:hypothetical protein
VTEIKLNPQHGSMAQRIDKRERNSGSPDADIIHKQGDGARRTFTNIHHSANHTAPTVAPVKEGEKR